jgi:hypothetical protein
MFWGTEKSTNNAIERSMMERKLIKNVNVKQNVNDYTREEALTISDHETSIMENLKHTYVSKT